MAYDPFAPVPLAANNTLATVGMVPGVPGSVATNPGGPVATPGGGTTGAPLQPGGDWRAQLTALRGNPQFMAMLPPELLSKLNMFGQRGIGNMQPGNGSFDAGGFRQRLQDWRSQRPSRQDFFANPAGNAPAAVPGAPVASTTPAMNIAPDYLNTGSLGG